MNANNNNVFALFPRSAAAQRETRRPEFARRWMPLGVPMMVAPGIAVLPTRGGDGESAWVANIYFQAAQLPARAVIYGDALVLPKCDISLACRALAPNGDLLMEFAFGELPGAAAERQR